MLCVSLIACGRTGSVPSLEQQASATAFVDVNVVPMDSERVLRAQTVVIEGSHITAIGPTHEVAIPAGALRVSANNAYLMPGLVDMHAHVDHDSDLLLFLAKGVTTVRNMAGGPAHMDRRERVARGEAVGPTIFTVGPIIDGPVELWPGNSAPPLPAEDYEVIETRLDGERVVREQSAAGYDFVKVYDNLTAGAYLGVTAAAAELSIPVVGHVPFGVGLDEVLRTRMASIEHLRGYIYELFSGNAEVSLGWDKRSRFLAWNDVDPARLADVVQATVEADVWNVPTLTRYQKNMMPTEAHLERYAGPEAMYVRPSIVQRMISKRSPPTDPGRYGAFSDADFAAGVAVFEAKKAFVKALNDAGAKILLGSDDWFGGFATHQELRNLVAAGLTPYQAIAAGTAQAATFLGADSEFGTVAVGKRADLALVRDNPLTNVGNAKDLVGVMVRGQWFPDSDLRRLLEEVVASYDPVAAEVSDR